MANTIDQIAKLIDKKTSSLPTKASVVRIDGGIVDITLGPGSGVIHHVLVYGDADTLSVGATYPIQWAERQGGYLAPLIVASGGGSAATVPGGTVVGDNETIEIVDGVASVMDGGIDQAHLSFTPSMPGHTHTEYAAVNHAHPGILDEWTEVDNTLQDRWGNVILDGNNGAVRAHRYDLENNIQDAPPNGYTRVFADANGVLNTISVINNVVGATQTYVRTATHTKTVHDALNINAGYVNGLTARGIAPAIAKDVTLYVNASTGVNDATRGYAAGTPLLTIQYAIDRLKGYALSNCKIIIAAGTYNENVNVEGINAGMFDGLTIEGDACELAGMMFIHGDPGFAANGATYEGSNTTPTTTSVYSDNNGAGGRMRVWVTMTSNPNFVSGSVTNQNYVIIYNGSSYAEYPIYSVASNVIVLDSFTTATSLSVAGRGFAIAPKVRIYGATVSDTYALEVFQTGVRLKGLYLNGYTGGLRAYIGAIMSERCVYLARASVSYYGSIHLTSLSFFFARFDSLMDAHNTVFGYWGAMVISYTAHANFGKCFAVSIGGYSLYSSAGSGYANGARLTGTGVGVYALARGYVNAAATSAANWCPTKYSPASNNTFSADGAMISYS